MTAVYLAGAENTSHQHILASCTAQKVAVNVTSLLRRKLGGWSLDLPYSDWEWVAYCDSPASWEDLQEVLSCVSRPPTYVIGPVAWAGHSSFLPLWNGEEDMPDRSNGLVITDKVFRDKALARRALAARTAGNPLGVVTGSSDESIGKFDLVVSGAWWSAMKYGETQVWDGRGLRRYNADRKSDVRIRHRDHIAALGVDLDAVLVNDDPEEVCRLAISSWHSFESSLSRRSVIPFPASTGFEVNNNDNAAGVDIATGGQSIDIGVSQGRHRSVLPVVGISSVISSERQRDGTEIIEEQSVLQSVSGTIRSCDNCYLSAAGCPSFSPGQSCAYDIPVEIRSKDQLQAVMQVVLEIQTQRVLMARFAEEVAGQELSTEVGREIDRLFSSVEKMRSIMDNRETLKMTVEARGKAGVLSRLFGDRVGANARVLSSPIKSDAVIDAVVDDV